MSPSVQKSKGRKLLIAIDKFFGVLIFNSSEDETISSFVGRNYHGKWQERMIDWIMLRLTGEQNHCLNSIEKVYL